MIIMKSGSTLVDSEIKTKASGPFSADEEVEKHLVDAGVAEYVADAAFEPVATPPNPPGDPNPGSDMGEDENGSEGENNGSEEEGGGDGIQEGDFSASGADVRNDSDTSELLKLTLKELKAFAEQKGIDCGSMKSKAEFVDAIIAAEAASDNGEDEEESSGLAPALSVKEPVI